LSERILRGDFSDPVETVDALIDEWARHRPLLAMIMALWAEATGSVEAPVGVSVPVSVPVSATVAATGAR
ncbi:hypothetical protein, partial [Corynebacterium bovis]|uniref:hypothetical protein n=1 Tax=Corynebacterium bovis TaxID=36808 RepID=UPI00163ABDF1